MPAARKLDLGEEVAKRKGKHEIPVIDADAPETVRYLFTTRTCPNCKIAKKMLGDEPYTLVDAEENQELVSKFGIMQAPTLVVMHDGEIDKYVNASNIKKYVSTMHDGLRAVGKR